ncbi:MAG TPA: hypothetical protein VFP00_08350 [Burkholderiales bacterium]|nr:hypothetical protein [Burkholderiales bacterium]
MRRREGAGMARAAASAPADDTTRQRPSAVYHLLWKAIRTRKLIACVYDDRFREACPHILGYNMHGAEAVFVFQFGGKSIPRLPSAGDWRCFELAGMTEVRLCGGRWRSGTRHNQPLGCIRLVDVDVDVPGTLRRQQPLAFGSPLLRPLRRSGE